MTTQSAVYALVKWLIDHIFTSRVGEIALPFVLVTLILRFFVWIKAIGKRERMDDMQSELEDSVVQTQTVFSPGYSELRQQGFSNRDIAHQRRQQPGTQVESREAQQRRSRQRLRMK